jgi:hypothetical protein
MAGTTRYEEIRPRRELRPFVECFWTMGGSAEGHRVLPDGCVDILFEEGEARVVGAMTRAVVLPPRRRGDVTAVRFRPGGAAALLGMPVDELTDRHVPLADVWRSGRDLAGDVADGADAAERVARIEDALMLRAARGLAADSRIEAAAAAIAAHHGHVRIEALAAGLGIARQHLARIFSAHVGIGPSPGCAR